MEKAWCDEEDSDRTFISNWHAFLQTEQAQHNVPNWAQDTEHMFIGQVPDIMKLKTLKNIE